jgi:hypothetical protein
MTNIGNNFPHCVVCKVKLINPQKYIFICPKCNHQYILDYEVKTTTTNNNDNSDNNNNTTTTITTSIYDEFSSLRRSNAILNQNITTLIDNIPTLIFVVEDLKKIIQKEKWKGGGAIK